MCIRDSAKAVKACERFAGVPGASVKACEKDFCKLGGADLGGDAAGKRPEIATGTDYAAADETAASAEDWFCEACQELREGKRDASPLKCVICESGRPNGTSSRAASRTRLFIRVDWSTRTAPSGSWSSASTTKS